jgi:hypothetical protein
MFRVQVLSLAMAVVAFLSSQAWAITIVKPVPPNAGGQITAVTDGLRCTLTNSGHYAIAQGTSFPYVWSVVPNSPPAAVIMNVTADGHTARFMSVRSWAQANNYNSYTITVTDTGDGSSASITVYPVSLDFVQGTTKDRVVEDQNVGETGNFERTIDLDCKGQVPVFTMASRAYHKQRPGPGPNLQLGTGTITETKYDGSAQFVATGPCNPAPGTLAPFGKWQFVPPGGVTTSWNAATQKGTAHTISVTGDVLSAWWNDIEIDIGIDQAPFIVDCSDGLGASMDYTVAEVDVKVAQMDETEEEATGEYLFADADAAEGSAVGCSVERVKPDDCTGYAVRTQVLGTDETEVDRVELRVDGETWSAPRDVAANDGLGQPFAARASSGSDARKDTRVRVKLTDGTSEVGGQTCRDSAWLTVLAADVINPVREDGGAVTTPVEGDSPDESGNEYTFGTDAQDPAIALSWRMTLTPDSQQIYDDIHDRLTFTMDSIGGSTPSWTDGHDLVYDSQTHVWTSRVTWTGLPSQNGEFGAKWCGVDVATTHGTATELGPKRQIEVFFDPSASNHPDSGTPNWFFYYQQAYGSACRYDGGKSDRAGLVEWPAPRPATDDNIEIRGGTDALVFDGGVHWFDRVAADEEVANDHTTGVEETAYEGIRCFISVVEHERWRNGSQIAADDRTEENDPDGDGVSPSDETAWGLTDGGVEHGPGSEHPELGFDSARALANQVIGASDDEALWPDAEVICNWVAKHAATTVADGYVAHDWARHGENWSR